MTIHQVTLRNYYGKGNQAIEGENSFLKNNKMAEVSMFSRGIANDNKTKYQFDDGYIRIQNADGSVKKEKSLTFDTDGDGFTDKSYKIRTLQNGKAKAHNTKYNSDYVNNKLAEYSQISDPIKKTEKIEKFKQKLLKAGISAEAIDKKFNLPKLSIHNSPAQANFEFKAKSENLSEITQSDVTKMKKRLQAKNTRAPKSESFEEKYLRYKSYEQQEKDNRKEARKMLAEMTPALKQFLDKNPRVLQQLYDIAEI